jgi:hypothetical protein
MLFDGKRASSLTTNRQLSDRQWALIQKHLGLPNQSRDDFEKIVAIHFKGNAARERIRADRTPEEDAAVAAYFADGVNRAE